ncbi:hypothetical protein SAMN05428985_102600 [Nocardioides sp. YR527]|uniref:hypothetical protein n=1 Tax=Nocardioides sp. YR527 TaxID=1881028 RepID=UPI000887D35C|nr:hypothetical protein [Nocardioides sp. YR527]SDK08671.1 hypothetical protein SAMN05428985_102600 [Nocardioides sp. YR527]
MTSSDTQPGSVDALARAADVLLLAATTALGWAGPWLPYPITIHAERDFHA